MELYVIRHAQSANNALPEPQRVEDPGITQLGHRQAVALAGWMKAMEVERLITSPFRRTLETTEYIHRQIGVTPEVWVELHELGGCYAGYEPHQYEGRPGMGRSEILSQFPGYRLEECIDESGWWRCQSHESDELARLRAQRLVQRTLDTFLGKAQRVAYIMHADFKRCFLRELMLTTRSDLDVSCPIYNTAVSVVEIHSTTPQVSEFNTTPHLSDDLLSS
jgi:2,3-bisphosphoglycerate-dependent phosphoglycerate mutase